MQKAFLDEFSKKSSVTKKRGREVILIISQFLSKVILEDKKVALKDFANLHLKTSKWRVGRNPRTGEELFIPPKIKVKLRRPKARKMKK